MYNVKTPHLPTLVAKEARIISKLQHVVGIGAWEVLSFRWIRLDSAVVDHRPSSHIDLASET
jgi:hypothetical protein